MMDKTVVIKRITDEKRLWELAQEVWEEDHEELLTWICDCAACSKVLDVVVKHNDCNENDQIVLCSLWVNERSINVLVIIPKDGNSYLFMTSIGEGKHLKQYKHYFEDNSNTVILLLPCKKIWQYYLSRSPGYPPFLYKENQMLSCIYQKERGIQP